MHPLGRLRIITGTATTSSVRVEVANSRGKVQPSTFTTIRNEGGTNALHVSTDDANYSVIATNSQVQVPGIVNALFIKSAAGTTPYGLYVTVAD